MIEVYFKCKAVFELLTESINFWHWGLRIFSSMYVTIILSFICCNFQTRHSRRCWSRDPKWISSPTWGTEHRRIRLNMLIQQHFAHSVTYCKFSNNVFESELVKIYYAFKFISCQILSWVVCRCSLVKTKITKKANKMPLRIRILVLFSEYLHVVNKTQS